MFSPTPPPAPDGPPMDVTLQPVTSQSIQVTWKVSSLSWSGTETHVMPGEGGGFSPHDGVGRVGLMGAEVKDPQMRGSCWVVMAVPCPELGAGWQGEAILSVLSHLTVTRGLPGLLHGGWKEPSSPVHCLLGCPLQSQERLPRGELVPPGGANGLAW